VRLAEGDTIRLDATPDKDERASVDYIEMIPQPR
jgi:translation initiation factor IF-1